MNREIDLDEAEHILEDLVTGRAQKRANDLLPGAELVIDGGQRVALARHVRRDTDEPALFWIRPLSAAFQDPGTRLPVFDPAIVRRRALHVAAARRDGQRLHLELIGGSTATVQPARSGRLLVLQDFDTWTTTIADDEREGLEALEHD
ncbi:hypothetical protein SAMN04489729_6867 [Amycolatopsis lurida]|uniref:Uncharacterized protein n=1 Tax=Amycolatopsis lurida NRRL 2430 TaxID=1460371 RepID=A0A2P2FP14_AMYLU|nr:hypothetical protein [Amycolatopsis lurida]KFU78462.1 hypothetical protein BB31_25145 [Amycolatopsis lurida NRRL 2430]SEE26150.1 hypothetical protein SAMN04489729_6867 [Amycolatopsis lurida]